MVFFAPYSADRAPWKNFQKKVLEPFFFEEGNHTTTTQSTVEKFTSKGKNNTLLRGVNRVSSNLLYINMVSTGIIKARYSMPVDEGVEIQHRIGKDTILELRPHYFQDAALRLLSSIRSVAVRELVSFPS